ncbi:unnamed protein product, partial [Mesorhabditis belari]|uniref:DUF8206 domain-containing protein n=1 Tax=Mesorhabditis belari TaxID=2138241 RepID=A0AAF3FI32_9BILA
MWNHSLTKLVKFQPTSEQRTERVRAAEEEVIRRAQQAANSINPWLREVTTEHARLFVETLNKSLWRIPQDDSVFSTELGKIDGCDVERKMKIEETEPKTLSKPSSPQNGLSSLETRDVELASKTSQSIATHCPQQPSNLSSHRHKTQQPREADEEALSNNSFEPKMTSSAPEAVPTNFVSPKNSQIHSSHQSNTSSAEAHDTQQNLKELAPAPIFTKAGESRIEAKRGNADWLQKQMENEAMAAEALMCVIPTKLEFCDDNYQRHEKKTFADSWSHSAMEVRKLLAHASRIRPHNTSDTLSINDTRTWIEQLIDPILKASSMIQTNIRKLHEQKRDLLNVENHIEYLSTIRVTTMKIIPLKSPQTVCTNVECVDFEIIDEKKVLVYKTVCHEDCRLHLNANLQECQVFGWTKKCKKCGHHIDEHERIKYKQKIFTQSLEAPQKLAQSEAETKKMSINRLESCINTYQKEFSYILFAMAAFSTFLAKKGMAQKINIFDEHLKKLLNDEVTKIKSVPGLNQDEYHQLAALRTEYHQSCRRFAQEHTTEISLQELQDIRQKLFSMPLTGSNISEIFTIHVKVDQQDHEAEVIKHSAEMLTE